MLAKHVMVLVIVALVAILATSPSTPVSGDGEYDVDYGILYGYTISFRFSGEDATSVTWDFGDGSPVSTEWDPTHTYASKGVYLVTQTAYNPYDPDGDGIGSYSTEVYRIEIAGPPWVDFVTNGGSSVERIQMPTGGNAAVAAMEPEEPTRDGYDFDGWYTDTDLQSPYDWSVKVLVPITLYAKWVALHTVTFQGSDIPSQTVRSGDTAVRPDDPVRDGYVFVGWFTDSGMYDWSTAAVSDVTLYARFSPISSGPSGTPVPEDGPVMEVESYVEGDTEVTVVTVTDRGTPVASRMEARAGTDVTSETIVPVTGDTVPQDMVDDALEQSRMIMSKGTELGFDFRHTVVFQTTSDSAGFGTDTMRSILGIGSDLTVSTPYGSIRFTSESMGHLSAEGSTITLVIRDHHHSEFEGERSEILRDRHIVSITLMRGGVPIDWLGGPVTVTIPHVPSEGQDGADLRMYHLDDKNRSHLMESHYDEVGGGMVMVTDSPSHYYVGEVSEDDGVGHGNHDCLLCIGILLIIIVMITVILMRRRT